MADERRRFPRIPLLAEAWITPAEGERMHVRAQDLSLGGVCVDLAPGTSLSPQVPCVIELTLPSRAELKIDAQIAWVRAKTAGIRFLKVSEPDRKTLTAEIESVLAELKSLEGAKTPT